MNDLKLNKELYKYEDIILVTKVFSHLALIEVEEDNNYWKCRFKNCRYNTEQTELEFENYLIDYINSKGRKNDHLLIRFDRNYFYVGHLYFCHGYQIWNCQ